METENEKTTAEEVAETKTSASDMIAKSKECGKKCAAVCCKNKKWIALVLAVVIIAGGVFAYKQYQKKHDIGLEAAKAKVEQLIKEDGGTVKEAAKDGDLYKVTISIGKQEQPIYITKDGTKLIQNVITFEEIEKQQEMAKKQEEENSKPIPKTDKPTVDLYVMSFCPYGNKAEDTLKPVYDLLKNKVDFNFHYIVSVSGDSVQSLHGEKEVAQNEREACVLKDYGKDKWFSFVSYVNAKCGSDGACWEAGAKTLGLNTTKITACVTAEGTTLMKAEEEASTLANATGSPTMKINGVSAKSVSKFGSPEEYKKEICDAFSTAPAECAKKLAAQAAATQASAQGGSCGN